jgi:hypothetical protein
MLPKIEVTRIITVKQTSLDFSHNGQFEKIKKLCHFLLLSYLQLVRSPAL